MKTRTILFMDPETGAEGETVIATVKPATASDVKTVLESPVKGGDGRSAFYWITLQNGDLILGVFPLGDTYEKVTQTMNQ